MSKQPSSIPAFNFFPLEERVLLSADGFDVEQQSPSPDVAQLSGMLNDLNDTNWEDHAESIEVVTLPVPPSAVPQENSGIDPSAETESDQADGGSAIPSGRTIEIVFIDSSVDDSDTLLRDLRGSTDDSTDWVIVRIAESEDGIERITQTLANHADVDAIHVLSHGNGGGIQLGTTMLDSASSVAYAGEIAIWAESLGPDADLLIYGCDLASTESGRSLIESLATLCECDVAASDDVTGHESLGGDWDLEFATGEIQTELAFGTLAQSTWLGTLDITSGLVGHYSFDSDASDSSGNNYDGTLAGDANVSTAPLTNQQGGGGLQLDGNGDYVNFDPYAAALGILSEGTFSAWINTTKSTTNTIFDVGESVGVNNYVGFTVTSGELLFQVVSGGTALLDVQSIGMDLADGNWHHVAVTVSATGNRLYVDGHALSSNNLVYNNGNASTNSFLDDVSNVDSARIGSYPGATSSQEYAGSIDEFRFYSRGLTASDITELYNADKSTGASADLMFTTNTDVSGGGTPGISTWQSSEVLLFGGESTYANAGTNGQIGSTFDLNSYSTDDSAINAIHFVSRDTTLGDLSLLRGDVLFSTSSSETISGISVDDTDILLFRPATAGDLSSGTISLVLDGSDVGITNDVKALTMAESTMNIGGTTVNAGDLLIADNEGDLTRLRVTATGSNSAATSSLFMDAEDLGIESSSRTAAVHLVSEDTLLRGASIAQGTILLSLSESDDYAGLTGLTAHDIVALSLTSTGGTTAGSGALLFDGSAINLDSVEEEVDSLALYLAQNLAVAVADSGSAQTAVGTVINVDGNDTDTEGESITVIDVVDSANGSVVNSGDGTVTYTSNGGFSGSDPFQYRVIDAGTGLQHYYGLQSDATDSVGSQDGTVTGATFGTGDFGNGLIFDEAADYVDLGDITYQDSFSVSFDFKVDDLTGSAYQYLYSHGNNGTNDSLNIVLRESGVPQTGVLATVFFDGDDAIVLNTLDYDANSLVGSGRFHNYTLTVDSAYGARVYIDGQLVASDQTLGGDNFNPTGNAILGARNDLDADRFLGGQMDSVGIFNRALGQSEVNQWIDEPNESSVEMSVSVLPRRVADIHVSSTDPVIDDVPEAIWTPLTANSIERIASGTVDNAADLSGTWKVMASEAGLSFFVEVTDDVWIGDSVGFHNDDSVGIYVDADNSGGSSYGPDDYQIFFRWTDQSIAVGPNSDVDVSGITYDMDLAGATRHLELTITWASLGITPAEGHTIAVDVDLNDDDDGGDRDAHVIWNDQTNQAWSEPTRFGLGTIGTSHANLLVTTTSDANDGDTSSVANLLLNRGADGEISLREALIAANTDAGLDTIEFAIDAPLVGGAHSIQVGAGTGAGLPQITDAVVLDGTTDPDFSSAPIIELNGAAVTDGSGGLVLASGSDGSTIRGFVINRFDGVGSDDDGIRIHSDNNLIAGNYIGTNVAGDTALANGADGIQILDAATGNTIGGTTIADRNVISGNDQVGIALTGSSVGNLILGNHIGVDAAGTGLLGNGLIGVQVTNGAQATIGGTVAGSANIITGSAAGAGIRVNDSSTVGTSILGNSIYSNSELGIDLDALGVSANDSGDSDTGANNVLNFPVLSEAHLNGTDLTVSGSLDTDATSTQFRIEFFGSTSGTEDATHGEGRYYLGTTTVTTDGSGDASFTDLFLSGITLSAGDYLTATATRITNPGQVGVNDDQAYGSTSEFGANLAINGTPAITSNGGGDSANVNVAENTTTVTTVTASDADLDTITYSITGGVDQGTFTIGASSGLLRFASAPNYEIPTDSNTDNDYIVEVTADDGNGATDVQTITVSVTPVNEAPSLNNLQGDHLQYAPGSGPLVLDQSTAATITDPDLLDFDTGTITVSFAQGSDPAEDVLSVRHQGSGVGQVGVSGSDVSYEGTVIGTMSGGTGGNPLVITFDSDADATAVSAVLQNITFENTDGASPTTGTRHIDFVGTDGDGASTGTRSMTVNVGGPNIAPTLTANPGGDTYIENGAGTYFDNALTLTDSDSSNFYSGGLTATIVSGSESADRLFIIAGNNVTKTSTEIYYNFSGGPILIGTYTVGSGSTPLEMSFNSNATVASVEAVARQVAFRNLIDDPSGAQRTIEMYVEDGDGGTSATVSRTMNFTPVNDAPSTSVTADDTTFNENGSSASLFSSASIDLIEAADSVDSIVLTVSNLANGSDEKLVVDGQQIELTHLNSETTAGGSYDVDVSVSGSTATVTISKTGGFSESAAESLLNSLAYENTSDLIVNGTRDITFVSLTDDGGGDDTDNNGTVSTITVVGSNDDPTNTGSLPNDITVTEDVSSDLDLSSIELSDLDHNGGTLTVRLTTSTGGQITAGAGTGIVIGTNGTSDITLTGTLANLNNYLDTASNLQYLHSTPHTFGNDADTVQVRVSDNGNTGPGGGTEIDFGTANIDISAVNDEQNLSTNTGATVNEGTTGNVISTAMLETTDVDSTDAQLIYTVDAIASNGTLRRSGSALSNGQTFTQADIDAGIITYDHNGSESPLTDSFDFTVDDGTGATTSDTFSWTITPVNDAPVATSIESSTISFTENDPAVVITSALAISDADDTELESAVVRITTGYASGEDVLNFTNQNGITGVWNSGSGTLTLSGTASLADYQAALRSITYSNAEQNPTAGTRTVEFTLNDGDDDSVSVSRDISVASINDDPGATGVPSDISVTEDVSGDLDLSSINLTDVDAASSDMTLTLSTATGGNLTASSGGGVTIAGSGTGTMTLTGSLADLNTYLDTASNIQYLHGTQHTHGNDADTISVVINDGGNTGTGGGTDQNLGTVNVDITAVNDEQTVSVNAGDSAVEGSTGNMISNSMLSAADVDHAAAQLVFTVDAAPSNGTLYRNAVALSASDTFTQADIDAGLISYDHDGSSTVSDSFDFTVDDGVGLTTSGTFNWTIGQINDDPIQSSIEGTTIGYTENDGAVVITSAIALTDEDDSNLESAVVQITAGYANGQDQLNFTNQNGISGSWSSVTGTLTLTGSASVADYQDALRSITYSNSSEMPSTATRTISFTVNDGDVDSNTLSRDLTVASINDDPVASGLPSDGTVTEDVSSDLDLSAINLSDVDSGASDLIVTLTTSTGGDLSASSGGGVTVSGSGTNSITLTGDLSDLNSYLNIASNIQYLHATPHTFGDNADTVTVVVNDGGNTGTGGGTDQTVGVVNVDISAVNDAPSLDTNTGLAIDEGDIGTVIGDSHLDTSDVDDVASGITFTLTDNVDNGTLNLAGFGVLGLGDSFTQADLVAGKVTYTHDDSETTSDSFDFTMADGGEDSAASTSATFSITVNPVDDNDAIPIVDTDASANQIDENSSIGTTVGVTAYSFDIDPLDSVTYTLDDDANGKFAIGSVGGVVTVAGAIDHESAATEDITIRASSTDGSSATLVISITINDVNEAPVANDDSYELQPGQNQFVAVDGVVVNDSDVDGDSISTILVTPPSNGVLTLQANGLFTYTPNLGFFGQDTFSYQLTDGSLVGNLAEVVIQVPAGSPPEPVSVEPAEPTQTQSESLETIESESSELTESSDSSGSEGAVGLAVSSQAESAASEGKGKSGIVAGVIQPQDIAGDPSSVAAQNRSTPLSVYLSSADSVLRDSLSSSPELDQLERILQDDLRQAIVWSQWEQQQEVNESPAVVIVGMAGASIGTISIGYVFWALRGGTVATVMASSLPAWRFVDPVAMLSAYRSSIKPGNVSLDSLLG